MSLTTSVPGKTTLYKHHIVLNGTIYFDALSEKADEFKIAEIYGTTGLTEMDGAATSAKLFLIFNEATHPGGSYIVHGKINSEIGASVIRLYDEDGYFQTYESISDTVVAI